MSCEEKCDSKDIRLIEEEWGKDQKLKISLYCHTQLSEQSRGHRQTILRSFALTVTGLLAVLAGVIIKKETPIPAEFVVLTIITLFWLVGAVTSLMIDQRYKSNEAISKVFEIETSLGCYQKGKFIPCHKLLPLSYEKPPSGVTKADMIQIICLILLVAVNSVLFVSQQVAPNSDYYLIIITISIVLLFSVFLIPAFMWKTKSSTDILIITLIIFVIELAILLGLR